uniref:Protein kinase domain-containing protein n=1 Tax=Strongyloides papillosus TaxID=174720 RepID=A0A0N5BF48_STREA
MVKQIKTIVSQGSELNSFSSCELLNEDTPSPEFPQTENIKISEKKFSSIIKPKVCSFVKKIIRPKCFTQSIMSYQPSLINNLSIISDFEGFEYIDYNDNDFFDNEVEYNHIPRIEEENLRITSTILGSGAFCIVHKAYLYIKNKDETKTVAFKEVINRLRNPIEIMNELMNEAGILYQMNHRNIIKLYGIYGSIDEIRIHRKLGLVLECCRGGSLGNLVHNIKFKDIFILSGLVKQIADGVNYLHQNNKNREVFDKSIKKVFDNVSLLSSNIPIVNVNCIDEDNGVFLHGDLKCDNILIKEKICLHSLEKYDSDDGITNSNLNNEKEAQGICQLCHGTLIEYVTLKIVDFGLSKSEKKVENIVQGTVAYLAPEIYNNALYTKKSDVYSFGVVLWEVFSGKKPYYENEGLVDIIKEINDDAIKYYESTSFLSESFSSNSTIDVNYSKIPSTVFFKNLIFSCLNDNYTERPSFGKIIEMIEELKLKLIKNKIKNKSEQDIAETFAEKDRRIETLEHALALSRRSQKNHYNTFPRHLKSPLNINNENRKSANTSTTALTSFDNNDYSNCEERNSMPIESQSKYIAINSPRQDSSISEILINHDYISISCKKNQ